MVAQPCLKPIRPNRSRLTDASTTLVKFTNHTRSIQISWHSKIWSIPRVMTANPPSKNSKRGCLTPRKLWSTLTQKPFQNWTLPIKKYTLMERCSQLRNLRWLLKNIKEDTMNIWSRSKINIFQAYLVTNRIQKQEQLFRDKTPTAAKIAVFKLSGGPTSRSVNTALFLDLWEQGLCMTLKTTQKASVRHLFTH